MIIMAIKVIGTTATTEVVPLVTQATGVIVDQVSPFTQVVLMAL